MTEAIQSVLAQTYADYEVIVVDDGSTDNTRDAVTGVSDRVIYVHQENHGPSSARNHGIRLARGKYIAFLDSDDLVLPTKLEKQVACMEKNPGVFLSHTSYLRMNADGKYIEPVRSGTFSGRVYPKIIARCPIATPTVMVRRQSLGQNLRFEENIFPGEDIILWTRLARESPVLGIDEPLTKIRIHRGSTAFGLRSQVIGVRNIIKYTVGRNPVLMARIFPMLSLRALLWCWHIIRRILARGLHLQKRNGTGFEVLDDNI
ncbi:MAG: glycosyltransferase family 2 protein [Dehalococcoidales bacterium]|nr:glycosyltransferase family 2 protein [Dehalococcoidales bacterium]